MSKVDKFNASGLMLIIVPTLATVALSHVKFPTGAAAVLAILSGLFGIYLIGQGQRLQKQQAAEKGSLQLQKRFTATFGAPPDTKNAEHIAVVRKHIDSLRNAIYDSMEKLRTLDGKDERLTLLSLELHNRQQEFGDAVNLALEFNMGA